MVMSSNGMEYFDYKDPIYENEKAAMKVLALIVAEFESDPMSVQCFDLRVVAQAKEIVANRRRYEQAGDVPPWLTQGKALP